MTFDTFRVEFTDGSARDFRVRSDNGDARELFAALEPGQPLAVDFTYRSLLNKERIAKLDCRDIRFVDVEATE